MALTKVCGGVWNLGSVLLLPEETWHELQLYVVSNKPATDVLHVNAAEYLLRARTERHSYHSEYKKATEQWTEHKIAM